MFVIYDTLLIFFAAILTTVSFFMIEVIKSRNYVIKLKINSLFRVLIEGNIFGGLFILFQVIMKSIYPDFRIPIYLFGFVGLVVVSNYKVAIFSIFAPLIWFLIQNEIGVVTYFLISIFLFVAILHEIFSFFINITGAKIITYSSGIFIALIMFFIDYYFFQTKLSFSYFELTILPLLLLPIFELTISYAKQISASANILYNSMNYDFGNFYRESLKDFKIGNTIVSKKINRAVYGVFEIDYPKQLVNEKNREVLRIALKNIEKEFPRHSILFKVDETRYGFFMPMMFKNNLSSIIINNKKTRTNDDPLFYINKLLEKVSKSYEVSWGDTIKINVFAGVSIYGIQESSLSKLDSNSKFALKLKWHTEDNRTIIFNPNIYRSKVLDSHSLKNLDDIIVLDNFVSRFIPIYDIKTRKTIFNYAVQLNAFNDGFVEDSRAQLTEIRMISIFERYFINDAISKVGDYKGSLLIDYSFSIFDNDFNVQEFIHQLKIKNIKISKLVFVSVDKDIHLINNVELVKKTLDELRGYGIKFAVKGVDKINFDVEYRLLSTKMVEENKIKDTDEKIILFDLEKDDDFKKVSKNKIKLFGGVLFEINIIPNNFSKQSKIYIKELISRER